MQPAPKLQPALYGGLFIGVLSALPLISAGNVCCCLWVVSGGALAAYLMQQNYPQPISAADGALVGLLAGLIGGIVGSVLSIPMQMLMGPFQRQMMERVFSNNPDITPEMRGMIENMSTGAVATAFRMVLTVMINLVFGMLGGLLGVAMFKKSAPPPPPGSVEVLPPV